jgi:hypothetical protein
MLQLKDMMTEAQAATNIWSGLNETITDDQLETAILESEGTKDAVRFENGKITALQLSRKIEGNVNLISVHQN